jgi:hypothetical protein
MLVLWSPARYNCSAYARPGHRYHCSFHAPCLTSPTRATSRSNCMSATAGLALSSGNIDSKKTSHLYFSITHLFSPAAVGKHCLAVLGRLLVLLLLLRLLACCFCCCWCWCRSLQALTWTQSTTCTAQRRSQQIADRFRMPCTTRHTEEAQPSQGSGPAGH